ncbi:MAG: hypothetical protein HYR76_06395 [Ignavibacteria bacterium]|nr:hypothetical protein [Ignavibacteria bacterium]MBI3766138.1 hypothetical protein [Ignavibacteriales bacterium]
MTELAQGRKSILVVSASAGAGHVRAGEALVETATKLSLPFELRHVDILDYTFPVFRKIYSKIQFTITDASPELWGYLYKKTEFKGLSKPKSLVMKAFNHFNYRGYLRLLENMQPVALLCTHFLPYSAIDEKLLRPLSRLPVFSVTTDYDLHALWVNPSVSRFYVACEQAAWTIRNHGVDQERIMVTGIPILPKFTAPGDKFAARTDLGLSTDAFTILILSGGYGVGVIDELMFSVGEFLGSFGGKHFQLLVSAAKNEELYQKLERVSHPPNVAVKLYQFVPYLDRLMDSADVLVTKAGGLTVTEALAKHLPMIIFDPTPGQENRNATFLTEHGASLSAANYANLHFKLKQLIDNPSRLNSMRACAERIALPKAAETILEDVMMRLR